MSTPPGAADDEPTHPHRFFTARDQPTQVPRRPHITGRASGRQQPLRRDPRPSTRGPQRARHRGHRRCSSARPAARRPCSSSSPASCASTVALHRLRVHPTHRGGSPIRAHVSIRGDNIHFFLATTLGTTPRVRDRDLTGVGHDHHPRRPRGGSTYSPPRDFSWPPARTLTWPRTPRRSLRASYLAKDIGVDAMRTCDDVRSVRRTRPHIAAPTSANVGKPSFLARATHP